MSRPDPSQRGTFSRGTMSRGTEPRILLAQVPRRQLTETEKLSQKIKSILTDVTRNEKSESTAYNELETELKKLNETTLKKLKRDYRRSCANPLWREFEDSFKDKSKSKKLIDLLRTTPKWLKQPPKKAMSEIIWPKKERDLTRKRLQDTSVWPKTYVHESLTPKIELYGELILDNYSYLIKFDNAAKMKKKLGLYIVWPKKDTRPKKKDDRKNYGDLECFLKFKNVVENMYFNLNKTAEELASERIWMGKPSMLPEKRKQKIRDYLERLSYGIKLFGKGKAGNGTAAKNFHSSFTTRYKLAKSGKFR